MATLTNSVSALLTSAIIPFVPLEAYFLKDKSYNPLGKASLIIGIAKVIFFIILIGVIIYRVQLGTRFALFPFFIVEDGIRKVQTNNVLLFLSVLIFSILAFSNIVISGISFTRVK